MNTKIKNYLRLLFRSAQQELKHIFRDNALYVTFPILPLVVALLYSTVYKREIIEKTPISVVSPVSSSMSRELIHMLDATQQLEVFEVTGNMEVAKKAFSDAKVYGILYIPQTLESDLRSGRQAKLSLYSDASNMLHNKVISTAVANVVGTYGAQLEVNKSLHSGLNYGNSVQTRRPISPITRQLFNPYGGYATFLLPVVYLVIIQTLLLTAIGVLGGTLREENRYLETYDLKRHPILQLIAILTGRALSYLLLVVLVFSIICGICFTAFKLPFRASFLDVLLYLIPFFLSIIFLGFALIGIFRKREDAALSVTFTSIPAVFLTGISWPAATFPSWVNAFSYLFPSTLGARGFVFLSQYGAHLSDVKTLWGQSWLSAIVYFLLALAVNIRIQKNKLI